MLAPSKPEARLVKLLKLDAAGAPVAIVGTGFLVSRYHVLTCAHVVAEALGVEAQTSRHEAVGRIVALQLRSDAPETSPRRANVIEWCPIKRLVGKRGMEDIALLQLDEPADFEVPIDVWRECIPGESGRFFGFGGDRQLWIRCMMQGRGDEDWVQLDCERREAVPGYSGAPVWDEAMQHIVGMVVARHPGQSVAYMISASLLQEVIPQSRSNRRSSKLIEPLARMLDRRKQSDAIRGSQGQLRCFLVQCCHDDAPELLPQRLMIEQHIEKHGLDDFPDDLDFGDHTLVPGRVDFCTALQDRIESDVASWLAACGGDQVRVVWIQSETVAPHEQVDWVLQGLKSIRKNQRLAQGSLAAIVAYDERKHGWVQRLLIARQLKHFEASAGDLFAMLPALEAIRPEHVVNFWAGWGNKGERHFRERFDHSHIVDDMRPCFQRLGRAHYPYFRDAKQELAEVLKRRLIKV